MKRLKRLLCIVLTVILSVTFFPSTVFASGIDSNADGSDGHEIGGSTTRQFYFTNNTNAVRVSIIDKRTGEIKGHSIDLLSPGAWDFLGDNGQESDVTGANDSQNVTNPPADNNDNSGNGSNGGNNGGNTDPGYQGEKEGFIYVPGFGYVPTSGGDPFYGDCMMDHCAPSEDELSGEKIGVM